MGQAAWEAVCPTGRSILGEDGGRGCSGSAWKGASWATAELDFTSWLYGRPAHTCRPAQGGHEVGLRPECHLVPSPRPPTLSLTSKPPPTPQ